MKLAKKIYSLELLRFFSAISVLFWHYQHFWVEGTTEGTNIISPVSASDQPLYNLLSFFYYKGYLGVTVFWAISGFIFFHVYFFSFFPHTAGRWQEQSLEELSLCAHCAWQMQLAEPC